MILKYIIKLNYGLRNVQRVVTQIESLCNISYIQKEKKLEELMTINGQLAANIAELKDIKMKRKPIYVLHD